jgi:flagellar basal body-associated protein FliL
MINEGLTITLVVLAVVAIAIVNIFLQQRRSPREVPESAPAVSEAAAPAEEQTITWTAQLTAATLDEAARLRLIDDLVLLRDTYSVALLRLAREEERSPHMRSRITEALAACGEPVETNA